MCQYSIRTVEIEREYNKITFKKKKTMKRGDRCYFFVFSLVYLVWGSLVYNIYHRV